jgi:hypothetical protein
MVEPVTIGVVAAALAAKALDRTEDKALDEGANALKRLLSVIRSRFAHEPGSKGSQALARVEEAADSPSRVRALADAVDAAAAEDGDFRRELEDAIAKSRQAGLQVETLVQAVSGDGNVQIAGIQDSTVRVNLASRESSEDTPQQ